MFTGLSLALPGALLCNVTRRLGDRQGVILGQRVRGSVRAVRAVWNTRVFQTETSVVADGIAPKRTGKGICLIVWGCFCRRNHGTFCPLNIKSGNKGVYVKPLGYLLFPVLKCVHDTLGDPICQQDNAPVHKAAVVIDFSKKYNIQIEDWSPYSPNLNPIKHVWVELKRRIHRKHPDIHQRKVFYSLGASRSV